MYVSRQTVHLNRSEAFKRQESGQYSHYTDLMFVVRAKPGEIDRVVLLAHGAYGAPEKLRGRKLFIVSRDDLGSGDKPRLAKIRAQYEKAPDPKELVILEGSAHAQFIFQTDQGERLMQEILRFLSAP
jgi:hypothetical protein